jgi:hypothetical protein
MIQYVSLRIQFCLPMTYGQLRPRSSLAPASSLLSGFSVFLGSHGRPRINVQVSDPRASPRCETQFAMLYFPNGTVDILYLSYSVCGKNAGPPEGLGPAHVPHGSSTLNSRAAATLPPVPHDLDPPMNNPAQWCCAVAEFEDHDLSAFLSVTSTGRMMSLLRICELLRAAVYFFS